MLLPVRLWPMVIEMYRAHLLVLVTRLHTHKSQAVCNVCNGQVNITLVWAMLSKIVPRKLTNVQRANIVVTKEKYWHPEVCN